MSGSTNTTDDDRIAELQRATGRTPPREPLPLELLRTPPPLADHSVLEALIQEPEDGR